MVTDTKLIEVTGGGLTTGVPDVSVTTHTSTPVVASSVVTTDVTTEEVHEHLLKVVVTGLGEENIPDPRLFKFLSDKFGLQEQRLLQVYKNLSDLSTTQEQVSKLLQKVLTDITTNSDVFDRVWTAYRTYTDSTTNQELFQKDFAKVLQDVANAPDLLRSDVGKYLADVTALANLSYAVILVGKDLQDQTIGFSDVLSRIIDFNRTFEDSVFTTDDFYGAANIDDDEYADVYKVVLEWIIPEERFAVDVDKPDITDQSTISEQAYLEPQLPKFDQVTQSDLQTAYPQLVKLDQTSNTEQQSFDINKPDRLDQVLTTEQASIDVTVPYFDQTSNTDQVKNAVDQTSSDEFGTQNELYSFDIDKPDRVDTATIVEEVAKDVATPASDDALTISELLLTKLIGLNINEIDYFLEDYVFDVTDYTFKAVHARDQITQIQVAKQFEDLVDSTDDFYGEANIDDDEYVTFDKVAADYVAFSDAFDRLVDYIRLFSETATLLEQVELTAQKVLSDQVANAEQFTVDTAKVAGDNATISELQTFAAEQVSQDTATTGEQAVLDIAVPKTDVATNSDQVITFFEAVRIFAEQTQTTERIEQIIERVSSDQSTFTDLVTQVVAKLTLDSTTNSEQLAFDFQANYSDLVDSTDDFYGEANVDDDEYVTFDKVAADYATTSELVTTVADFNRTFLETAASVDVATLLFAKSVLEVVAASEVFAIDFSTSRTETVAASETVQQDFGTARSETVTQADLFTQSIEPAKYETVATSELNTYDVGLAKTEAAALAELFAVDFSTSRTEIASILEQFVSQWDALRSFTEAVQQSDLFTQSIEPLKSDTVTNSDLTTLDTNKKPLDVATTAEVVAKDATTELSELVDATDDFYGAATVGDDEYADFQKSVSDYATNADLVTTVTTFLRSVNESQILSEVFAAATDKALSDITNSSDTVTLLAAVSKTEIAATSQTISLTLQSYFSQDYVELGYTGETYTY